VHYNGVKPYNRVVGKFCTKGSQSLLSLLGTKEKKLFFSLQTL
jgi:hypothetical protein